MGDLCSRQTAVVRALQCRGKVILRVHLSNVEVSSGSTTSVERVHGNSLLSFLMRCGLKREGKYFWCVVSQLRIASCPC